MIHLITHRSLHLCLGSLVRQRGRTAELEVHWVWRTFWDGKFHSGTCLRGSDCNTLPDLRSTCCGHRSPTKVVNHVLQCGNNKLSGNKAISMLMTPRLPKEIISHFFSSFAKNAFLIENYHHMLFDFFNTLANFPPRSDNPCGSVYILSLEVIESCFALLFSAAKRLHEASHGKPIKLNDCLDVQLFFELCNLGEEFAISFLGSYNILNSVIYENGPWPQIIAWCPMRK